MVQTEIAALAANAARLRREQRLSQTQVARRGGIHRSEVSMIERGMRDPRLSTLVRLARGLGVKLGQLLDGI
jgi:transcriptional regulator with XRE-family HTH domain